ncbi:MAG: branched-chain amino acid transport system II carrier protein, partial [Alphaproteobacteria bacterium]|nr:branched-chain amino acid transport system II carrier protein [Alphaproteobacteria bacterium]
LLALVYTGLAYIGAKYSSLLSGTSDEALFAKIADISMGNYATIFVTVVIAVGCLGTNVAITAMFTDYIHKTILKEKFNRNAILLTTGVCTLGMSLLGFAKICSLMAMILSKLYPALIVFVVLRIAYYFMSKKDVA